jgi:hypothetical protein
MGTKKSGYTQSYEQVYETFSKSPLHKNNRTDVQLNK